MPTKFYSPAIRRLLRIYPSLNLKINVNQSRTEVDVVLPGLRFDDIDQTGQPNVWRMFDMVNTVEIAAFHSNTSFLFYESLYKQNFMTIVKACILDIKSNFYETTTPKAPLDITVKLSHIGKTSFSTDSELTCGGKMKPSIKIKNLHTILHQKSRKVENIPDWWRNRFEGMVPYDTENKGSQMLITPKKKPVDTFAHIFAVPLGDADFSNQTRCASYLRYFLENASIATNRGFYKNIQQSFHEFHMKKMTMLYISPSCWGDRLISETWEDEDSLTLYCQISKYMVDKTAPPVWYGKLELYSEVFGVLD